MVKEHYYQKALHQKYRLKYHRKEYKDILEGDNPFFKAAVYYQMKGYQETAGKDWSKVMLTEQVLRTCYAIQNYGSQLIYKDKEIVTRNHEKSGPDIAVTVVEKLYEDGVTMLFRELFNLAFGELYGFTVHDQEKRASTGNAFGGAAYFYADLW